MKAKEIMTPNPRCVTPDTRLQNAARLMKEEDVGILPVVDEIGSTRLIGVLTDRDIALRCVAEGHDSSKCSVREVMTTELRTARPDQEVDEVMDLMGREQVRRIPIVDEKGGVVGIIAQADIMLEANDRKAGETVEEISMDRS
ncbi:MAG: CBS domain-containing protein [Gemmatimonadaceae bacterium]